MNEKIRFGLYGSNGHQIQDRLRWHTGAVVAAVAEMADTPVGPSPHVDAAVRRCASFEELVALPDIDCVSLCSPFRRKQAGEAIRALRAGKHVLAEKPCAMTEADLDAIIRTARETGCIFHEMSGTAFDQPYLAMRELVLSGRLGEVVQIVAEKSYPYFEARPQDEAIDGGQIGQCMIHALRFVEHVACVDITSLQAFETTKGNPKSGGNLVMAASLALELKNGGIASLASNYLNPRGTGVWGNESLKILGTEGMVESREGGGFTRVVVGGDDLGPLDVSGIGTPTLDAFIREVRGGEGFPIRLEKELSPTRWAIRAKASLEDWRKRFPQARDHAQARGGLARAAVND